MSAHRLFALLMVFAGCAAPSFQPRFVKPGAPSERVVLAEIMHSKPRDERPVAVGVTSEPTRLCAWDINAGLLWERPVTAKSAPLVVADAVVMQEANGIVVRDLTSGEVRLSIEDTGHLIGADGEGKALVIAIGYDGADPRAAVAFVEGDSLRWKQKLNLPVGVPALVSGYVLVPWATQRLSVLSSHDGRELARWDFQHAVLGYAEVDRGRVFIGQHGFLPLDQHTLEHAADAVAAYTPFKRPLPGQPPLLRDGYEPVQEPGSAAHLLKLDWRIGAGSGPLHAENDMIALRFYRLLFALDAREDRVRWVRTFEQDLVGAAMQPHGLFVAERAGALHFIDENGEQRFSRELGRKLLVLTIRPGEWVPTWTADDATSPPESLRAQLFGAAALHDDRLTVARAYAIEQLTKIGDAAVTANLIALCGDRKTPAELAAGACANLAARQDGADDVMRALSQRASFLEGDDAPPVGALAKAAAQMKLQPAAPLLTAHMEDPSTQARDLVPILNAIEQLGHRPAAPALERFVRMHHAEPEDSELEPALYAALHALGSLRARNTRPTLVDVSEDWLTPEALRGKAREAVAMLDAPPVTEVKPEPKPAAVEPPKSADTEIEDPRPYALDKTLIRTALRKVSKELSQCLPQDPTARAARVSMVVQGGGEVEGVFVIPATLQACIEPLVRRAEFPATRSGRQRVTHVVYGPNAQPIATKADKNKKAIAPAKRQPAKQNVTAATPTP